MEGARSGNYTFHVLLSFVDNERVSSVSLLSRLRRHGVLDDANLYVTMISHNEK
jgi:hypothetical protein